MKASSKNLGRFKILAAVAVPLLSWWFIWHYYHASKQADETISEEKKWEQASNRRALFVKKYMDDDMIEATEVRVLNTWRNGLIDPDSVWYDQRRRANEMLMEHGLPALDGRKPPPDTVPLSRPSP